MGYIRLTREIASVLPATREAYRDLVWLANMAHATWQPIAVHSPDIELVACFRDCTPMVNDEPVWSTECEYDCEEWVHCGSAESTAVGDDARPPTDPFRTSPSLAEVCALPPLHEEMSSLLPESSPGLSQGEVPE